MRRSAIIGCAICILLGGLLLPAARADCGYADSTDFALDLRSIETGRTGGYANSPVFNLDLRRVQRGWADADLNMAACQIVDQYVISHVSTGTHAAIDDAALNLSGLSLSATLCYQFYNGPGNSERSQLFLAADWAILATIADGVPGESPGILSSWSNANIPLSLVSGTYTLYAVRTAAATEVEGRTLYETGHGGYRVAIGYLHITTCAPGINEYVLSDTAQTTYAAADRVVLQLDSPSDMTLDASLRFQLYRITSPAGTRHQLFLATDTKVLSTVYDAVPASCPGVLSTYSNPFVNIRSLMPGSHSIYLVMTQAADAATGRSLYERGQAGQRVLLGSVTTGTAAGSVAMSPSVSYDPGSRLLGLTATVTEQSQDGQYLVVTSGTFTWVLKDSVGTIRGSGSLSYDGGQSQWTASQTFSGGLASGTYQVTFSITTPSGRVGTNTRPVTTAGQYSLTGKIRDRTTRQAISGVTVTVGQQSTQTNAQGDYSLAGINPSTGPTLSASKPGYATCTTQLTPPASGTQITKDLELTASDGSKPVVTKVEGRYNGVFVEGMLLAGWSTPIDYKVAVDWQGEEPGTLQFYANSTLLQTVTADPTGGSATIDVPQVFQGTLVPGANALRVIAVNSQGMASEPYARPVTVLPLPSWLTAFLAQKQTLVGPEDITLAIDFDIPTPPMKTVLTLPVLGKFGVEVAVNVSIDYTLSDGDFELAIGPKAEGTQGKRGRRPSIPGITRTPRTKLYVGNKEITGQLYGEAHGTATVTTGIRLEELVGGGSLEARLELGRFGVLDLLGPGLSTGLGQIPGLGDALKNVSIIIYVIPGLQGEFVWGMQPDLHFEQFEFGGDVGLEAAYEPDLGICKARFYVGGKPGVTFQLPGDFLKELRFKAYAGAKFETWLITLGPFEYVFVNYSYPNNPAAAPEGELMVLQVGTENTGSLRPFDRSYLERGAARFVVAEAATGVSSTLSAPPSPQAYPLAIDAFRALGKGAKALAAKPAGIQLAEGDGPLMQADLPLIENVFPNSEPSLAASGSELMLVYVSDNGAAGDLQFTDINWTRFDGTNWSVPAPILADTRAEFAPRVVFDGNGDAIAVCERVKDLAFTTVDIAAMAARMEIVWSRWDHTTGTWAEPVAMTDNEHLDHMPLLCGPMADGSLLVTWTENTESLLMGQGIEGTSSNDKVNWSQWNPASQTWTAPQPLVASLPYRLSQSLSGTGSTAVYAWTRDMDGNLAVTGDQEMFTAQWTGSGWSTPIQRTNDTVPDSNVRVAVASSGTVYLVWQQGDDLVMDRDFSGIPILARADSQTAGFADYALTLGPGGNLLLIWQEQSQTGVDARYAVYDPASGRWSRDEQLFSDPPLERSFSAVWDDVGNLTLAYNRVEITATTKTVILPTGETVEITDVPTPGRVDLGVLKRAIVQDLAIQDGDFTAEGDNYLPGDQVKLLTKVRNVGNLGVQDAVVALYDGDPTAGGVEIARKTIAGWLDAATVGETETEWTVPEPPVAHSLYAVIDPDGTLSEINEANNAIHVMIGATDLSATLLSSSAEQDGSARIVVEVLNAGAAAPSTILAVRRAGETGAPLATAGIPALEAGRCAQIAVDLPAGTLNTGENLLAANADDEGVSGDADTGNNQITFGLLLVRFVAADLDRDGDVDSADWALFEGCATGPGVLYDPQALQLGCELAADRDGKIPADLDQDNDVDQVDFGVFQRCCSGENVPADPNCGN